MKKNNPVTGNTLNTREVKNPTLNLVMTGLFTAVICVLSQLSIPTQPIPFTFALLAIFLTGALLTPRYAFMAVLIYLLLGAFGLPVFASGKGGLQALIGMTGGYLMTYPFMALVTSFIFHRFKRYKAIALVVGMLFSLLLCYLFGTLWFSYVSGTGFGAALALCVYPFILFDILKIALATSLGLVLHKTLAKVFI